MNLFHNLWLAHLTFSTVNLLLIIVVFIALRRRYGSSSRYKYLTNDLEGDMGMLVVSVVLPITNVLVTIMVLYLGIMHIASTLYQRHRIKQNARRS